jgi:signal peptidase II
MSVGPGSVARRGFFLLSAAVLVLDQATKIGADFFLRGREPVTVIPGFFRLWYSRNAGGLFGYFRDWEDPWRTLLLTALPLVAIVLIALFLIRSHESDRPTLFGLSLILGGATGNLVDRVLRGEVVDFLDVYVGSSGLADRLQSWFGTAHWPTFNVADSAIVCGAGLLLLSIFRSEPASQPEDAAPRADAVDPS